jgi:hypothetical protein
MVFFLKCLVLRYGHQSKRLWGRNRKKARISISQAAGTILKRLARMMSKAKSAQNAVVWHHRSRADKTFNVQTVGCHVQEAANRLSVRHLEIIWAVSSNVNGKNLRTSVLQICLKTVQNLGRSLLGERMNQKKNM